MGKAKVWLIYSCHPMWKVHKKNMENSIALKLALMTAQFQHRDGYKKLSQTTLFKRNISHIPMWTAKLTFIGGPKASALRSSAKWNLYDAVQSPVPTQLCLKAQSKGQAFIPTHICQLTSQCSLNHSMTQGLLRPLWCRHREVTGIC